MNTKRKILLATLASCLALALTLLAFGCAERNSPSETCTVTVLASPASGGTVAPEAFKNVAEGERVSVTATAAPGYVFLGWTVTRGDAEISNPLSASTAVTVLTASSDAVITANFAAGTYTLNVNASPAEGGTVSPDTPRGVALGTAVNISATANEGYAFHGWTVAEGEADIANPDSAYTSVSLASNAVIAAVFEPLGGGDPEPDTYTLSTRAKPDSAGNTTPKSKSGIEAGVPVSVSATAAAGYQFVKWTVAEGEASFANQNAASTPVILNSDAEVTANFQLRPLTLTVSASPTIGGTVSPTSRTNITMGTAVSITATPEVGYAFTGWLFNGGNGGSVIADQNSKTTTLTMGSSNASVIANFNVQAAAKQ